MSAIDYISSTFESIRHGIFVKIALAGLIGYLSCLCGNDTVVIEALVYLILIDWITGIMKGIKYRQFTSQMMAKSVYKLILYFLLLVMAHQALKISLIPNWFDEVIESFLALTEIKSILENSATLGFPIAEKIEKKLNKYFEGQLDEAE